jgi:uncharacterized protein (DUF1501 family)
MKRMLRTLGLALVAVFAMSAVVASAASANFTTTTDTSTLTLSGGLQVFTSGGGAKFECTSESGHIANVGTAQSELTVVPFYSGCTLTEGGITRNMEIDPMGCAYVFTTTGQIHIECSGANVITVKAFIAGSFQQCFDIHPQTPTTPTIDFSNQLDPATSKWDFTIKSTIEGITYERTGPCKKAQAQENETNSAHYEGSITVTCDTAASVAIDCTKTVF